MALGLKIQYLKVLPFGFSISFRVDTKNYNKKVLKANLLALKKIIVSFAGPFVNLGFIVLFLFLNKEKIFNIETEILIYVNLLILIFNTLLIYPLDGGRILKNILYLFFGKITALTVTNIVSMLMGVILTISTILLVILLKNISYLFALVYIWVILIKENEIYKLKIKIYKILKNDIAINQD